MRTIDRKSNFWLEGVSMISDKPFLTLLFITRRNWYLGILGTHTSYAYVHSGIGVCFCRPARYIFSLCQKYFLVIKYSVTHLAIRILEQLEVIECHSYRNHQRKKFYFHTNSVIYHFFFFPS